MGSHVTWESHERPSDAIVVQSFLRLEIEVVGTDETRTTDSPNMVCTSDGRGTCYRVLVGHMPW